MKEVYPVYLTKTGKKYIVNIPDFHNYTEGKNLADAIDMARDAIGALGLDYEEDDDEMIPKPFSVKYKAQDNELLSLIDIDFDSYRAILENKLVKKNCTIPYYLEKRATEMGLNFSRILVEALQEKTGIVAH